MLQIQGRIAFRFSSVPMRSTGKTVAELREIIANIAAAPIDEEDFAELTQEAVTAGAVALQEPNAIQDGATRLEAAAEQTRTQAERCTREEAERCERAAELAAILKAKDDLAATQREEADRLTAIERQRLNDEAAVERKRPERVKAAELAAEAAKKAAAEASKPAKAAAKLAQAQKCGPRLLVLMSAGARRFQKPPSRTCTAGMNVPIGEATLAHPLDVPQGVLAGQRRMRRILRTPENGDASPSGLEGHDH